MDIGRRHVLGASVLGVGAGVGAGFLAQRDPVSAPDPRPDTSGLNGAQLEPFHGRHQAGVETVPQAHALFIGLDLEEATDARRTVNMLRLLTDDAAALTRGTAPLADPEPELTPDPARLTVTFGFGEALVARAGRRHVPDWLHPLEEFSIDRLEADRSRGDLLLQICGDDALAVSHAARMLLKDSRAFARVAWSRTAFRRAYGSRPLGTTQRNMFGQVDGTANPGPGSEDFARLVWGETTGQATPVFSARGEPPLDLGARHPAWLRDGGTTLVLRDIAMDMKTWDEADRPAREFAVGRDLARGAPLTGREEHDVPDLAAVDARGLTVISPASHVARSRNERKPEEQIFRRVYNYHAVPTADAAGTGPTGSRQVSTVGLMFASYQADIERQFLPIQRRLDGMDLLNQWTTPIGSTVWAIPPGVEDGDYVGSRLFEG